jgi:mono/diheme cytochrome c family protein
VSTSSHLPPEVKWGSRMKLTTYTGSASSAKRIEPKIFGGRLLDNWTRCIAVSVATVSFSCNLAASDLSAAKAVFAKRCMACHTYGHGAKVGPDLKRVTDRREREWLFAFIRSSSTMIASGDPAATQLFRQFRSERMPDWTDLSSDLIAAIVDYLKADGPDQKQADERNALTASTTEIDMGRRLFHGKLHFAYNLHSCSACHTIRDPDAPIGGSLGPDLTGTYVKYRDKAITDFLRHPCIPQEWGSASNRYLTPQESFAIKAYLAHAVRWRSSVGTYGQSGVTKAERGEANDR